MDYYHSSTGNQIPIIDDTPEGRAFAMPSHIEGKKVGYGYVPRDFTKSPVEMFEPPSQLTIYPESDWDALWQEQEELKNSLEHLYLSGPNGTPVFENLDQDGDGYCWCYSTGHGLMFQRLKQREPLVRLNPHSLAAIIKGGRDEGGWCGLSGKGAGEIGYAEEGTGEGQWPLHSRDLKYDTPACRERMKRYRVQESWMDLTRPVYDQVMTRQAIATCGFTITPAPQDFNWWSHSVCGIRWVRIEAGSWGPLILNSWLKWGRYGLAVLRGSQAKADNAIAIRSAIAA